MREREIPGARWAVAKRYGKTARERRTTAANDERDGVTAITPPVALF
jgi:hypothetical protein